MAITTVVLPDTTDEKVCLGFAIKLDSEAPQLDAVYKVLKQIRGARVEYLSGKTLRADVPIPVQK